MGIYFAMMYFPAYIVACFVSVVLVKIINAKYKGMVSESLRILSKNEKDTDHYYTAGFIFSIVLTWSFMWLASQIGDAGYQLLVFQLALTFLTPICFGLMSLFFLPSIKFNRKPFAVRFVFGVLGSTIAMPWIILFLIYALIFLLEEIRFFT